MTNYENQDISNQDAQEPPDTNVDTDQSADIKIQGENLAETWKDDELLKLGEQCRRGFETDLKSREEWEICLTEWTDLAKMTVVNKTYPWPEASNVKYPLLSTAAMQFAARAYPSLVPANGQIVKSVVIGKDLDGQKLEKADRVSDYMSYQLMHEMDGWEEDMDKMLMMLPVVGTMFKKTWYDKSDDIIRSCLILPRNLVVNYWTKSLKYAERVSEIIFMSQRLLKEKQNEKIFKDIDLGTPSRPEPTGFDVQNFQTDDETTPYTLIEQHTFFDYDKDGYAEPYIVTFERYSAKILSVIRRYKLDDVELKDDKKTIKKIKPLEMFTKFGFVPNPDGSFYDIGFGVLLGPLNEAVNTSINQLVDAGTLSNLQAGFMSKALRLRMGDQNFRPGEWKSVNGTGDDLRKQIVPLPTKEPSPVLLQLMQLLITSGKELASVAEIFTGKMPGQNTPATTTMATVEQGMKVFTAVYKRIFRALSEEFYKIFDLNSTYLDPNKYVAVIDATVGPDDFDLSLYDICPGADPTAMTQSEKLQKAQGLMEIAQGAPGILDPIKVVSRILEAQEQPSWQDLLSQQVQQTGQPPQPPPDPKVMALQMKMQADQQKAGIDTQKAQVDSELKTRDQQTQLAMQAQQAQQDMELNRQKAMQEAASNEAMTKARIATETMKAQHDAQMKQQSHQQTMVHQEEKHKLQQSQMKNSKIGNSHPSHGNSKK